MTTRRLGTLRYVAKLTDEELSRIQMRLEYDFTATGRFVRKQGSSQKARFVAYRFRSGAAYYYREDLDNDIVEALSKLAPEEALCNQNTVYDILGTLSGRKRVWAGFSYVFDHWPNAECLDRVKRRGRNFAFYLDGKIVSVATTARHDRFAAEIIVNTIPRYRRHRYASAVAVSWARFFLKAGKIPFYSHITTNRLSHELAQSLHLRKFCVVAAYD